MPATPPSDPQDRNAPSSSRPKPRLRGISHEAAAFAMLAIGPLVVLRARTATAEALSAVYVTTITAMLSTSALLHRINWSPPARRRMRQLDHSMIFFAIAGSYTAAAGLVLPGTDAPVVIAVVWVGALGGAAFRLAWLDAPKWVVALPYIVLGWLAVAVIPEIFHAVGSLGVGLLVGGGLLYTAGAVVYARRRPDPWPTVFGYHEIFHALVVCAVATHLCLVAFVELPRFAA
ncbi:MAG: hemolysin III family protein [Actinomycetota bacterium]|nr:hemolysin III family protein [Actinomycetota bacterium]